MLLQEAIAILEQGLPVYRESWDLKDGYLQLMAGMDYIWKIMLIPNPNAGNYIFTKADLIANDWEKFEYKGPIITPTLEEIAA